MKEERGTYMSYLLRLWRIEDRRGETWRASLERPGTREREGFSDLDSLFDFIRAQTRVETVQRITGDQTDAGSEQPAGRAAHLTSGGNRS